MDTFGIIAPMTRAEIVEGKARSFLRLDGCMLQVSRAGHGRGIHPDVAAAVQKVHL